MKVTVSQERLKDKQQGYFRFSHNTFQEISQINHLCLDFSLWTNATFCLYYFTQTTPLITIVIKFNNRLFVNRKIILVFFLIKCGASAVESTIFIGSIFIDHIQFSVSKITNWNGYSNNGQWWLSIGNISLTKPISTVCINKKSICFPNGSDFPLFWV